VAGQQPTVSHYPSAPAARDRWILARRMPRNALDPVRPYAIVVEPEFGPEGYEVPAVTIFLTNRECPWRCLMCDLWRNTLEETVPAGSIAAQIHYALGQVGELDPARCCLKLYNAGSFFDPRAIPPEEYPAIAALAAPFGRTIVESHPALVGPRCVEFQEQLGRPLEVAMGLETVHPEILNRLNKRMTLDQFRGAAETLAASHIDLRAFILVRPPWLSDDEGVVWAKRSLDFAIDCGAGVCSLIPTRAGNGAMEALLATGEFTPPSLAALEASAEYGLELKAGRVFADLWDIEQFAACPVCSTARIERLRLMNATQRVPAEVTCRCQHVSASEQ
jgi:radical SAM enzyme (TIGR01210 family)